MSLLRSRMRVLLTIVFALAPGTARADLVGFSYSWNIAGGDLNAFGPGPLSLNQTVSPDGSSVNVNYGGGNTTLTVAGPGTGSTTPGGVDFSSATPAVISLATLTTPALTGLVGNFTFSAGNIFTLHLTDTASGQSGDLNISGSVNGNVSPSGTSVGLSAFGDFLQSVTLGGHVYTVDALNTLPDSTPGDDPVSFVAQVYIDRPDPTLLPPLNDGGGAIHAPEPSSLFLAGFALSLLGGATLRKRHARSRMERFARAE